MTDTPTRPPRRGVFRRLVSAVAKLVLLAVLAAAGAGYWHYHRFTTTPVGGHEAQVEVRRGESLRGVIASLRDAGVEEGNDLEWQALAYAMGVRSKMQVGEYAIAPDMTPEELLRDISTGKVIHYNFRIGEGWNMRELRAALKAAPHMQHRLAVTSDAALMQQLGRPRVHPEGRFLPETYAYTRDSSDIDLLDRAAGAMDNALGQAWEKRDPAVPLKSQDEALILASIVEKETGIAGERARVAGVFVRRLKAGMRLQTDPSVIYGLGGSYDGNIRKRDLYTDTPYNTYTRDGLPPTPIAMPGRAAIEAATHPAPGTELYFVASRNGGPAVFSTTLAEHNKAVADYLKAERDREKPPQ